MSDIQDLIRSEETAYAVRDQPRNAALERTADLLAACLVGVSIITVLVMMFLTPASFFGVLTSLITIGWLVLIYVVVRVVTELLRILKRSAGVPFEGTMTGPSSVEVMRCSICVATLDGGPACPGCGRAIVHHGATRIRADDTPPNDAPPNETPASGST
ncbi:MAG: hypothetical protein AB8G96_15640 [Phycisphaerales bacterium]